MVTSRKRKKSAKDHLKFEPH